jgi:hypothetical protein
VAAGRTAVAVLSTLTVPFVFVAGRRQHGLAVGVIGAFFVATSHLLVSFGGTELPRPVSAMLLAAAFALLLRPTLPSTILAALLVAVAAALRFSEAIFALPAAAMLLADRRWGRAALFVAVTAAAGVAIQAIADQTYWGTPFYSLRQAIDYTLVQRQSTRGFQPFWHYLTTIPEWTAIPIVAVAAFAAWRGAWRPALWTGVPIFVLSLLPHKEARYLLPIVPFVSLLAAIGLWQIVRIAAGPSGSPRRWAPMAITAGVFASTILSISGFHVQRSDAEVALARSLAVERNVSGTSRRSSISTDGWPGRKISRPWRRMRPSRSSRCGPRRASGSNAANHCAAPVSRNVSPRRVPRRRTRSSRARRYNPAHQPRGPCARVPFRSVCGHSCHRGGNDQRHRGAAGDLTGRQVCRVRPADAGGRAPRWRRLWRQRADSSDRDVERRRDCRARAGGDHPRPHGESGRQLRGLHPGGDQT